jgi:hypothetical protein
VFVLFVEGETEEGAAAGFLKRWLDPRLSRPVGVVPVYSRGCDDYLGSIQAKVHRQLTAKTAGDVVAAIAKGNRRRTYFR